MKKHRGESKKKKDIQQQQPGDTGPDCPWPVA
jgi:hypothetical protein